MTKLEGLDAQADEGKLPDQQQNFISDLMAWSEQQLALRDKGRNLVARWALNGTLAKLSDAQIQAISSFAHLDAQKITNGVSALQAVDAALGDDVSGNATSLILLHG